MNDASPDILPDRLRNGDRLRSPGGYVYTVKETSQRDSFDEPVVRLTDDRGRTSPKLWSRDELAEASAVLVEAK